MDRRARRLVLALLALCVAGLPAGATAHAGVFLSQGGAETKMGFVSGWYPFGDARLVADGFSSPPPIPLTTPGTVSVRVEDPGGIAGPGFVVDQLRASGSSGSTAVALPVTRLDASHWSVDLPAWPVDESLWIGLSGGTLAAGDDWSEAWHAVPTVPGGDSPVVDPPDVDPPAVDPPVVDAPVERTEAAPVAAPRVLLSKLRAAGRDVRATVRLTGAPKAAYTAYVVLRGRRVSAVVSGQLRGTRTVAVTLRRATAKAARRSGRLVVRTVLPDGALLTTRAPLPR